MATEKKFRVHWLRAHRCYVIVNGNGREVGRYDEISEAWADCEQMERDAAARAEARRRTAAEAGAAQAARMRTAAARSRRFVPLT